jgi:hypothetical protein
MGSFFHVVFFVKRLRSLPLTEECHTGAVDLLLAFRRECMYVILWNAWDPHSTEIRLPVNWARIRYIRYSPHLSFDYLPWNILRFHFSTNTLQFLVLYFLLSNRAFGLNPAVLCHIYSYCYSYFWLTYFDGPFAWLWRNLQTSAPHQIFRWFD